MNTPLPDVYSDAEHADSAILHQQRYHNHWRFFWRDILLRPLGFTIIARPDVHGIADVPKTGPTIVIYNHINFFDPVILLGVIHKRYAIPISKVENLSLPYFGTLVRTWGVIPVQRRSFDRKAIQDTIALLHGGYCMLISPEGTRRPALGKAHEGFTYAALKTNAVIVPAAVEGTPQIGKNIKKLRRTRVSVKFGTPFRFNAIGQVSREAMHHMTTESMYQLSSLLSENLRGVYHDLSQMTTETLQFVR